MAPQATEIFYITLKPGVELEGSSTSAQVWTDTVSTLQRQDGFLGMNYGLTIEIPNLLIGMIHWQSIDFHHKFEATPEYQTFKMSLSSIFDGVHLHHFIPTPSPPSSILNQAPVIEFVTFFQIHPDFPSAAEKWLKAIGTPAGNFGYASGETVEEVTKHADIVAGKEDSKGKGFVFLIGWESVQAHMNFRETETFKSNIGLIRGNHGGPEMFHVAFKTV